MSKQPWWDARNSGSFFDDSVYRLGDMSREGHLLDAELSIDDRTDREINGVVELAAIKANHVVLDCPCGEGRHTLALAEKGLDVIGIDLDPNALQAARSKLDTALKMANASFKEGSMNDIPLNDKSVDVVLNMFFSFGFFESEADNQTTLNEFHRVLRSGGKLVIETDVNPDLIQTDQYGDREIRTLDNGQKLRVRESFDEAKGRLNGSWEILTANMEPIDRRDYSVRIYTHGELKEMAAKAGFSSCEVFSFPDPAEDVSQAPEITYLAIK